MNEQANQIICRNEELARDYLSWLRNTRGRTGGTIYNYGSVLTPYLAFVAGTPLAQVKLHEIEAYVQRPRGGRARGAQGAAATQMKDVTIIRAFYGYLVNRGALTKNPAALLGAPRVHNQNPRPIPDADWIKLWDAANDGVERTLLGLGFFVGLRRREVCELTPTQVFTSGGRLVGFKRKGGGDDITPYSDLCEVLDARFPQLRAAEFPETFASYVDERSDAPFLLEWGEQVPAPARERAIHALPEGMTDPNLLNKRMNRLCERAGVAHYTPHQMRHSFVTNLLRAGVPLHLVQRTANHSSPAITSRYIKAGTSELREWFRTVNRHG